MLFFNTTNRILDHTGEHHPELYRLVKFTVHAVKVLAALALLALCVTVSVAVAAHFGANTIARWDVGTVAAISTGIAMMFSYMVYTLWVTRDM